MNRPAFRPKSGFLKDFLTCEQESWGTHRSLLKLLQNGMQEGKNGKEIDSLCLSLSPKEVRGDRRPNRHRTFSSGDPKDSTPSLALQLGTMC